MTYTLDAKIEEVARALGITAFGLDTDVTSLSGGQRTKAHNKLQKARHLYSWTSRHGCRTYRVA